MAGLQHRGQAMSHRSPRGHDDSHMATLHPGQTQRGKCRRPLIDTHMHPQPRVRHHRQSQRTVSRTRAQNNIRDVMAKNIDNSSGKGLRTHEHLL